MKDFAMDVTKRFGGLTDSEWLERLKLSVKQEYVDQMQFPGFPPAQLQAQFVGSSFEAALNEAGQFYGDTKTWFKEATGRHLDPSCRVLDFGVGWGRIIRFFWRDVGPENLYGVDVDPEILQVCRATRVPGTLEPIQPGGRLPFPDGHFDLVFAYSVFTHLAEEAHLHWMTEIRRVLRPGGLFVGTLEPRRFIDFIARIPEDAPSSWHKSLKAHAGDAQVLKESFDQGEFVYIPTGGGKFRDASFYGDAVVPLAYVQSKWQGFEIRKYVDDPARYWQAVLVAARAFV